ncbi:MAG: LptF/LptG family permease [Fidelibacterota bacterium]
MRLLNRYILKEMFPPFFFSLLIITFILFTNFLLRAIDRFLGKGLTIGVILEYLFLNLAWIIALSVPMAVLIAALMTFGRLSEDNEITAMRSSGISFLIIIRPALLFGLIIALSLTYFNNFILPEMNFRARILSGDIYRKRPGLNINPGHFIDDLPDYGMIIQGKTGDVMERVFISSKNNRDTKTNIIANTATLHTIDDALVLTLYDGEIQEIKNDDYGSLRRIGFEKNVIILPADDLVLNRRDTSNRSDREMTIPMMLDKLERYDKRISTVHRRIANSFKRTVKDSIVPATVQLAQVEVQKYRLLLESDTSRTETQKKVRERRLKALERQMNNEYKLLASYHKNRNKYEVEIHKKFSLPVACILFILVGSPLGVLAKKGGFVVGVSLSFGFFLVYYILLIAGEEMADRSLVSPTVGMWAPNVVLGTIGLYLTLRTVREREPFDIVLPAWLQKQKRVPDQS